MIRLRCTQKSEQDIAPNQVQYQITLTQETPSNMGGVGGGAIPPGQFHGQAPQAQQAGAIPFQPVTISFATTDPTIGDTYRRGEYYVLAPESALQTAQPGSNETGAQEGERAK